MDQGIKVESTIGRGNKAENHSKTEKKKTPKTHDDWSTVNDRESKT